MDSKSIDFDLSGDIGKKVCLLREEHAEIKKKNC